MTELLKGTASDISFTDPKSSAVVIDFLSFIQSKTVNVSLYPTFNDLILSVLHQALLICQCDELHIVFDSYVEGSLKATERLRRNTSSIELSQIDKITPLPRQMEKFWGSTSNKVLLQKFAAEVILKQTSLNGKCKVVVCGMIENDISAEAMEILPHSPNAIPIPEFAVKVEEADMRLICHISWTLQKGQQNIIVVSTDTDVIVLLLYYYEIFRRCGLKEIWLKTKSRIISVHKLADSLGSAFCSVLLAMHIGTGCGYISKVGTKQAAMKVNAVHYLNGFGHG